jgi:type II secretory pathway pseudopilin PulG
MRVEISSPLSRLRDSEAGTTLVELLVAVALLLIVSSVVATGLQQMTVQQRTINNRTQMHNAVRSASELLQQEVGQAGRVSLPGKATLAAAVVGTPAPGFAQSVGILIDGQPSVAGIFVGEFLVIDTGSSVTADPIEETVEVTAVDAGSNQITAIFFQNHNAGVPVTVSGGFPSGVVPPTMVNGSTGNVLKLYGDINDDGQMVYVEYNCDLNAGLLYRQVMPFDFAGAKPAPGPGDILLDNIRPNPDGSLCFTYMPNPLPVVGTDTFVLDVAITLTVQTQFRNAVTNQFQVETKALLNVSPRNVFNVWQLASAGYNKASGSGRVQPMPPTVAALLQ